MFQQKQVYVRPKAIVGENVEIRIGVFIYYIVQICNDCYIGPYYFI